MLLFLKKIFLIYFAAYLAFTPLVAYGVPLKIDGSTNTTLDKARNNVPIVNIANPNSNGLSHNKFIHYNVGSEGLILNNSKQTNINTQLGGIIFGNKGLTNNATLILNEVTSTSRSSLKGWTEVAGQKADLIIANPNGLTINGAGFINTNNITLTTGKSTFDNNQFNGFIVNGGDVLIEGTGLDTSNQDSVNVYSHYLQLNAGINAKNINIKLGKNIINGNGSITQSSNSGQVQNLLLDTSALGGMYANRITLVGTDQGLGVNLPPEVSASTGGIFIDNKGNISLQKMSAKGDIQITSSDEVSVKGNLYSEQALDIHADHKIDVIQGIVSAKNVINISSEKLNNQSQIIAGLNADLTQNSHGILNINATKTTNQGIIQAVTNLNLATNELNNQTGGSIVAGNDLSIKKHLNSNGNINNTASNLITNAGTLHANNNTILASTLNNSGDITASKDLNITATDISATGGEINANNTNITANNLTNTSTNILAVKDIDLQIANLLTNNGKIQANQTLNLNAKTLDNQKDIIATNMTVITDDITNSGNILTVNNLTINNTNKLTSTAGKIQADNQFTLTTHELDNQANIVAKNANITATTKTTNQGAIQTTQDLNLVTNELNNQTSGSIVAGNDLSIKKHLNSNGNINNTASNLITNAGTLHANNNNTILATTLTNTNGNISASKDLNITATDITATGTNTKISANNTNITTNNLSITDTALLAINNMILSISNLFTNQGTIQANQQLDINAKTLDNQKDITANNLNINTDDITNGGNLLSANNLVINNTNKLTNTAGNIQADNQFTLTTNELHNQSNIIAKNANITATTKTTNQGSIQATQNINLATNELDNQTGGSIIAGNNLNIKKSLDGADNTKTNLITNAGTLHANNNQSIIANTLNNSGDVTATNELNIAATNMTATGGKISANDTNITTTNNLSITDTALLAVNNMLLSISNLFTNQGTIQANQQLDINAKTLDNQKDITANNLNINTDDITNSGNLLSANNLVINNTNKLTNTAGNIQADNQFTLTTNELNNQANIIAKNTNITATTKTTNSGTIQTTQTLNLATNELNNQTDGSIIAGTDLIIKKHLSSHSNGNSDSNSNDTKTNFITNQGTLHANNNNTILATTLNNSGDITATKELNITATDITTTGANTKISANNTNITTNNLSIIDTILSAVNNINLQIANLLTNQGKIQANQTLNLNAKTLDNQKDIITTNMTVTTDDITNSGNILTVNDLTINNTNKLTNTAGNIQADNQFTLTTNELDNQANIIAKNANITATTKTTNQGTIQATQNINLATNELDNQTNSSIVADNDLSIKKHLNSNGNSDNTASNLITNAGTLHANNNQSIFANRLNNSGDVTATNELNITATNMTTTGGKISANDTNITTTNNLSITDTALLAVNNMLLSISNLFTNQGTIQANQQLDINAKTLDNQKDITANNLNINTDDITNSGNLLSVNNLVINTTNKLSNISTTTNTGTIQADNLLTLNTNELDNQTNIIAKNANITATTKTINSGSIQATQALNLATDELNNQTGGSIIAGNNLNIKKSLDSTDNTKTNLITNAGTLHANNNNTILAATLTNTNGNISASKDLNITATDINTTDGEINANNTNITANNLTNTSTNILAVKDIDLQIANLLTNNGKIQANQALNLNAKTLDNQKDIIATDMTVTTDDITNSGNILTVNDLTINNTNKLTNTTGKIQADNQFTLTTNELDNQANIIAKNANITATTKTTNQGTIQATQNINLATNELDNQTDSSIVAGNNLNIKKSLDSIDNTKTNLITNAGTLHANNNQSIFANTLNNSGDITATNELNITATNITTTGANTKISANNTNITTNNLSITDTALLAVNNMLLNISNLFTNRGTTQSNQALTLSAKTLDNQQYIIANNATLTTEDITNSGTIHAKNNLTIATNDFDNNHQVSSDSTLNITTVNNLNNQDSKIIALGDITIKANNFNNQNAKLIAYGASNVDIEQNIDNTNGDISAKSMILDTDSIDVNNSKIYANKDLKIIIPHLNNTVGSNIGSGGDLTIDAKDYIINNAELTANGNFDLITQGDLTNNNLISSEGALTISADNLTNNETISGGTGNSNINITGDVTNHSRISSKENLNVTAQNITNNGFFNAAQDLTLTTSNNLTNNQTLFSGNDMKLYVANELNNTEDANIFAYNNLTIAKDADNNKTNKVINDKATIQTYQGDIDVYAKSLENKAKQAQIGTTDAVSSSITLYYGYYGASDVKTKWGKPMASLAYTDQAIALAKIKQIEKGNYYNIYTTNENICVNDGCTINGIFYDKSEINASSRVVKGDTIFDTYTVYSYSYKDRSNQADSLVKHTSYTTDAIIEELDKYYEKYGLNVASSHIPEERNDEYTIPAYTIYYFTDVPRHGIIQQATVNIKEDYLINQPEKKAQLSSGGNLNINVDKIDNYLSEISARNDINFNSNEVNNVGDRLYRYNKKTGQYYYCYHDCNSWIYSPDYTWADLPSSTSREVLRILPSTIQAGGSITGNINNLNNGNINGGVSVSTIPSQTQTTTTTANTQSIAQQNNNVNVQTVTTQTQTTNTQAVTNAAINTQTQTTNQKAVTKDEVNTQTQTTNTQAVTNTAINTQTQTTNQKAVTKDKVNTQTQTTDTQAVANNKVDTQTQTTNTQSTNPTIVTQTPLPITLPTGTTGLFVQSQNPQTDYLIETNPEFTLYNNFISSDYLLKHINFNPDKTLKRIGDGFYEQKLIKEQLLQQTGRRFLTKDITSDNAQYQQLMDNAITQQKDLELSPGVSLTTEQIAQLTQDIVWMEPQTITLANGTTTQALIPRVYIANTHQYQVEGSKIIAGKDISLTVNQLKNTGLIKAGDNLSVSALDNILNQGGTLQAGNTLTLLANNDISNISANIQAKNITLTSINGNINNIRFEKNVDYSQGSTKDTKKLIGEQSNIIANNITLTTNKNINLAGSNLNADNKLDLNANNVVLTTTQQVGDFYSGNSKNYLKENATTNLKSQIKATDINISANEQVIIKGTNLQADNQINIQSKALNIASVKDTTNTQLHSESKGGLFGGGHNDTTTTSTTDNIQSTLQAKDLIITNKITQVQASKLKADTIKITTDLLNLVSDKDLDFKQIQTESSGFLTKTITDKGHNKQTKVIAVIKAKDKLSINNQQLTNNQLTNKRLTNNQLANTQLTPTQIQQLKQLSSADALNTQLSQQLKAQGITLSDVKISNKNWDESTTTLSGLGAVIVQVAAMYFTGGFDAFGSALSTTTATTAATTTAVTVTTQQAFINAAMTSVNSQLISALATSAITGNSLALDPEQMLKTALTAGASQYALKGLGVQTEYDKTASFNENLIGGVQRAGVNATVGTAINGGSLSDNLKTNLGSEVLSVASAKLANKIGDAKAIGKLNEFTHKAAHAALGCAGAKIQGKDCGSGAIGAVVGEVIAEQVGNNASLSDSDITAISRVGTAVVAQGLGKDVGTADTAATNAVENNYLTIREQINYAQEMTICGKNGNKCKNDTRKKYQTIYDKNRQAKIAELNKELSKPPFLRNKYKTRQEIEVAINLIKDRPFREEIIKIPEQNLHDIEVISPEEYISRVEVGTIKGVKAVGEAGFSLTVPGRVYEIGSNVVDLANDLQTGNFDNTANNVVDRVAPKGLQKIGIPKTASELIPGTISLGNKLSNDN